MLPGWALLVHGSRKWHGPYSLMVDSRGVEGIDVQCAPYVGICSIGHCQSWNVHCIAGILPWVSLVILLFLLICSDSTFPLSAFHWVPFLAGSASMSASRAHVWSTSMASKCLEGAKKGRWPPAFCEGVDLNLSKLHLAFIWNHSLCLLSTAVLHCSNVLGLSCWEIIS